MRIWLCGKMTARKPPLWPAPPRLDRRAPPRRCGGGRRRCRAPASAANVCCDERGCQPRRANVHERVAHAVGGGEIDLRRVRGPVRDERVELRLRAVGEKNRAGLRVERLDVPHAVVLLVLPGQFVLLDDAAQVFLATGGGDQAGLRVVPHDLAVEVEAGLRVLARARRRRSGGGNSRGPARRRRASRGRCPAAGRSPAC